MTWEEVCADPSLKDLPFKIELRGQGKIILRPITSIRGEYQASIGHLLRQLRPDGVVGIGSPVETRDNTKVADVSWMSRTRHRQLRGASTYTVAPEICVEILSPSNTREEMMGKKELYFDAGAEECWLCDVTGEMTFLSPAGFLRGSPLCPEFPSRVQIED